MAIKITSIPGQQASAAPQAAQPLSPQEAWNLPSTPALRQYESQRPGIDYSAGEQQYAQAFQQPYEEPTSPLGQGLEKLGRVGTTIGSAIAGAPGDIADILPLLGNIGATTAGYEAPFSETALSDLLGIPGSKRIRQAIGVAGSKVGIHPKSLEAPAGTWESTFNNLIDTVATRGRSALRHLPRAAVRHAASTTAAKIAPERLKPVAALAAGFGSDYLANKIPAAKKALNYLETDKKKSFEAAEEATQGRMLNVGPALEESKTIGQDIKDLPDTENYRKLKKEYAAVQDNIEEHAGRKQVLRDEHGNILAEGAKEIEQYNKEKPTILGSSGKPLHRKTEIVQNEIPADQALKLYRIYNDIIYDPQSNARVVEKVMKLRNSLGKVLDNFGTKNKEFGNNFRKANFIHQSQIEANKVGNFLGKNVEKLEGAVKDKRLVDILVNSGITAAGIGLGHASLGKAALAGVALAGTALGAYGAGKYAKFKDLMKRYKPLRESYNGFEKALAKQNLPDMLKFARKTDEYVTRLGGLPEDSEQAPQSNISALLESIQGR